MGIPVIGITGTVGKTTTKEMLASILKTRWNVLKSELSNNVWLDNYIKLLNPTHQAVLLEFASIRIKANCELLQPNLAAITIVTSQHMNYFGGNIQGVANAKSEMIRGMDQTGILFLNGDDPNSDLLDIQAFKGKIFKVGILNERTDYYAYDISTNETGITFYIDLHGKKEKFFSPALGKHNVYNALFALGLAEKLGFNPTEIRHGLEFYEKPSSRLIFHRIKDKIIIDDSFSSSLAATIAAIDVLEEIGDGIKVAVLGPTLAGLEYDNSTEHQEIGNYLANKNIDFIFTLNDKAKEIGVAAKQAGFPQNQVTHSSTKKCLYQNLLKKMNDPKITFLVKGSIAMQMYNVTTFLKRVCEMQTFEKSKT